MLESLFGSEYREKVLIFILARGSGYAAEIAQFFNTDLSQIQKQLDGMEAGGVLISQTIGRTRPYEFSPRYPFLKELKGLLEKALFYYPEPLKERLAMNRRRPRRRGKPL
jgi:predicted transcriptional regulator